MKTWTCPQWTMIPPGRRLAVVLLALLALLPVRPDALGEDALGAAAVPAAAADADSLEAVTEKSRSDDHASPFGSPLVRDTIRQESISEQAIQVREAPPGSEETFDQFLPAIEQAEDRTEQPRPPPFYEAWLKDDNGQPEEFDLDLVAVSVQDLIPAFAEKLGFNYLVDPKVSGAVSLHMRKTQMTRREMWQLFEQILWLSGAYCSPEGGVLRIMPFVRMPQERRIFAEHQPANVEVKIVRIRNVPAKSLIDKIQPFLTEGSRATELAGENAIMLVESPENMEKLDALIDVLDRKQRATWPKTAIRCVNVPAARIKEELAAILPVLGLAVATDNVVAEPGSIHLTSIDRMEVIVASAANQEALDELKKWVSILDRADVGEQERVFVYKVINGTAEELLQALAAIFTIEGTSVSASSTSSGTGGGGGDSEDGGPSGMRGSAPPRTTTSSTSVSSGRGGGSGQAAPASIFEVPAKIFADGKHNRMVIRTTPRTYAMIKAVLETLDTVPSQILLQVLIAEIRLSEGAEMGLEYYTKSGSGDNYRSLFGYDSNLGGTPGDPLAATSGGGMKYMLFNKNDDNKYVYLRAAANTGNFKILSSPQLAAVSGTAASIDVGEDIPIITRTVSDGSGGVTSTNNEVQYRKTGILLKITPQVTKGGLITMDLSQEVSQRGEDVAIGGSTYPSFIDRQMTTSLSIRDGGTIIVGGIIQERERQALRSVPLVAKIPLLASLFGLNTFEKDRTELLIMITASVISEATDLEKIISRYKESVASLKELEEKNVSDAE
jgi:general secretion pathway protein D